MRILVACALDARALDRLSRDHEVESCPHPTAGDLARRRRLLMQAQLLPHGVFAQVVAMI